MFFINKIDEQSIREDMVWLSVGTYERTQITSNINLLMQWNEWVNLLILQNEANLI